MTDETLDEDEDEDEADAEGEEMDDEDVDGGGCDEGAGVSTTGVVDMLWLRWNRACDATCMGGVLWPLGGGVAVWRRVHGHTCLCFHDAQGWCSHCMGWQLPTL